MVEVIPELRGEPISGLHNFARITPALFGQFSLTLDQDNECREYGVPKAPGIIKNMYYLQIITHFVWTLFKTLLINCFMSLRKYYNRGYSKNCNKIF